MQEDRIFPDRMNPHPRKPDVLKTDAVSSAEYFRLTDTLQGGIDEQSSVIADRKSGYPEHRGRVHASSKQCHVKGDSRSVIKSNNTA